MIKPKIDRPRKADAKSELVAVRFSKQEREQLEKLAKKYSVGGNISAFVRYAALNFKK